MDEIWTKSIERENAEYKMKKQLIKKPIPSSITSAVTAMLAEIRKAHPGMEGLRLGQELARAMNKGGY